MSAQLSYYRNEHNTGIMTRMPRHRSRCLRTVATGLSRSALSAALSGKLKLQDVCGMTADVILAFTKLLEGGERSQHLKQHNTSCCANGTMNTTLRMARILMIMTKPWQQKSGALATSALRESCTYTK